MSQTSYPCTPRLLKRIFERNIRIRRHEDEHERKFPSKKEREARAREAERKAAERERGSDWQEN